MNRLIKEIFSEQECPRKIKKKKQKCFDNASEEIDKIFMELSNELSDNDVLFEKLMKYERLHIKSNRYLKEIYFLKGLIVGIKLSSNE